MAGTTICLRSGPGDGSGAGRGIDPVPDSTQNGPGHKVHGHLHRERVGPKSLANKKAEGKRVNRPSPNRQPKPAAFLLSDVIREYLGAARGYKRSYRDDARYGRMWTERFGPGCSKRSRRRTLSASRPSALSSSSQRPLTA